MERVYLQSLSSIQFGIMRVIRVIRAQERRIIYRFFARICEFETSLFPLIWVILRRAGAQYGFRSGGICHLACTFSNDATSPSGVRHNWTALQSPAGLSQQPMAALYRSMESARPNCTLIPSPPGTAFMKENGVASTGGSASKRGMVSMAWTRPASMDSPTVRSPKAPG